MSLSYFYALFSTSLREYRVLIITDLGILPADCPISRVITINEVITLFIIKGFPIIRRILSSKGFPVIIRYVAFVYHKH